MASGSSRVSPVRLTVPWRGDLAAIEPSVRAAVTPAIPVRWAVVAVLGDCLAVEAAVWSGETRAPPAGELPATRREAGATRTETGATRTEAGATRAATAWVSTFTVAQILPTGIGLETGGYAGDGTPATNLLAAACDHLVTHPNAVNAALFNWAAPNVLYVEGALLDRWLGGRIGLRPVRANRVGLLIDRGVVDSGGGCQVENAGNAFRTVGGGSLVSLLTAEPLALELSSGPSGSSHGGLANPEVLLGGARELLGRGAEAIALVTDFSRLPLEAADYLAGRGPDPVGGLEAILSHLVALALGVPCAHAPWFPPSAEPCDPRAAAEELGAGYLVSVLRGLWRAPRPVPIGASRPGDLLGPDLVVAPDGALGGPGVIAAASRGIPLVAVRNPSVLAVDARSLGIRAEAAASYLEAAGIVLAHRAGLDPAGMVGQPSRTGQDNPRPGQDNPRPGQDNPHPGQDNPRPGQDNPRPG